MLQVLDFRFNKKTLQTPGRLVKLDEVNSVEFKQNIKEMTQLLKLDGVGLAATQVGWPIQLFMLCIDENENKLENPEIYLNPSIIKYSKSQVKMLEGCLSFDKLFIKITRPLSIKWKYQNLKGEWIEKISSNFFSRVIQHEVDHCQGRVFINKATTVQMLKINKWLGI